MKRAYKDPMAPYVPNRWSEIHRARKQLVFHAWTRSFFSGLITGLLVIGTTLLIFGWMPWWPEIKRWLLP